MPTFPSSHEPGCKGVLQQRGVRADNPYESPPRAAVGGQQQQSLVQQQHAGARRAPPAPDARGRGADKDARWGEAFGGEGRDVKRRRAGI